MRSRSDGDRLGEARGQFQPFAAAFGVDAGPL
jgi:hypothetical protein